MFAQLKIENKLFMELMAGPQSKAQQYFFFAERQAAKVEGIGKDIQEIPINKVGVIGGGCHCSSHSFCFVFRLWHGHRKRTLAFWWVTAER